MANNKKRVNTDVLFQGLIGKGAEDRSRPVSSNEVKVESASPNVAKKSATGGEAKKQVSLYLPISLDRELGIQGALKEKELDKSSIARSGIEIVLALPPQLYLSLKDRAASLGKSLGELVKDILETNL